MIYRPYFEHTLKAGAFFSHLVWIMGPLSGLIVAPLVGVLSDRCTLSFGRRRPFILGGLISCLLGMNLFSNATRIAFNYLPAARIIAFLSFGLLDFATNAIMFPSRALLGDLLPAHEQHRVQSAAAVVASLAEICAGAYLWSWRDPVTHISTVFATASVLLAITCTVSLIVCKEVGIGTTVVVSGVELEPMGEHSDQDEPVKHDDGSQSYPPVEDEDPKVIDEEAGRCPVQPHEDEDEEEALAYAKNEQEPVVEHQDEDTSQTEIEDLEGQERIAEEQHERKSVWGELVWTVRSAIVNFPRPLIKVGIVYGLAWFVWFASLPFYSNWMGKEVLNGDPQAEAGSAAADAYQTGVNVFSVANVFKAGMALVFSAWYPSILAWVGSVGERVVFGGAFMGFAVVLWSCAYTKNVFVAAGVVAVGAVPFIVTQTIPIAILVARFPENLASNLGVLNLFCVVPQLIDTLYTGKVAEIASESAVLRVAAAWAMAAGLAALICL